MWKVRKWIEKRTVSKKEYEEEKREFEMAIGKPYITLKIELPIGFEDQRSVFLDLENDSEFIDDVKDQVRKTLLFKKKEKIH